MSTSCSSFEDEDELEEKDLEEEEAERSPVDLRDILRKNDYPNDSEPLIVISVTNCKIIENCPIRGTNVIELLATPVNLLPLIY